MADLMDKIEVQKLMKILDEKDIMFTVEDIQELMDAELEKPPAEMDTELIDLCVSVIGKRYSTRGYTNPPLSAEAEAEIDAALADLGFAAAPSAEAEQEPEAKEETTEAEAEVAPKKRRIKAGKILLIAAVVAALCAVAVPVGARFVPSKAADKIVDFCHDHFKIDLRGEDEAEPTNSDSRIMNNLILESLHTLKLPEVLLGDEYVKTARVEESDLVTTIYVNFSCYDTNLSGAIMITEYKNGSVENHNGVGNISGMNKHFKQISSNNTDILIFGDSEKLYITYVFENTEYEISLLNVDFDTAVKIAESIK